MSKFMEAVRAKMTGQKVAAVPELEVTIDREFLPYSDDFALTQYDIGVECRIRTHCKPVDLKHVLDNAMKQLREDIYGQFRRRALEIQRAAYERDYDKMHMHIRDLLVDINA
jgi:hypothetical protein